MVFLFYTGYWLRLDPSHCGDALVERFRDADRLRRRRAREEGHRQVPLRAGNVFEYISIYLYLFMVKYRRH